jgi:flagellar motor switch protein FliN/FliY
MFSQEEIDAVLNNAQQAVDDLVEDVAAVAGGAQPPADQSPSTDSAPADQDSPEVPPQPPADLPESVQRLLKLKVPVVVRLAHRKSPVSEILKLVPGTILEFDKRVDTELDLLVNNRQIGSGVAVKVEERFGLRVTFIGDIKQRIASLAG